jgi:uncharacterized protein (TIGR02271 family)
VETSGHNFLDAVKRLFGGETDTSERGGAVIKMRGNLSSAAPIVERYGGQIADGAAQESDGGRMTLHEEQLDVQKHEAKQGEVRLTKQVVTDQKEIDVPVNREEVILSRHKIDEPDDDATIGEGEDIRIPVMRDEVDVDKRTVATEEVGVEKRDVQSTEHVSAAVQKERARLETDGRVGTTLDDER